MNEASQRGGEAGSPLFTVLVPTYNHAGYLPAALDTLLAQTLSDWEAVVVNDGSTDESPAVMERYAASDRRFRVVHKKNGGASSALNEGIRHARGEWICWLSSDDFFEPDKLEVHFRAFRENPAIRFFHSHFSLFEDSTGVKSAPYADLARLIPSPPLQLIDFFKWNYVHGNSIAVHRSVFERVGFFNENLRNGQDFDMWMRIGAHFPFLFLNRRTCVTRVHSGQGTVIFPEAGIFDSTRACVEYLNQHRFVELFPFLDLRENEGALTAAAAALEISKNPDSFINRCGYNTALLERLNEYLVEDCPEPAKRALIDALNKKARGLLSSRLPENVKWQVRIFRNGGSSEFRYIPHDFLGEIMRNAEDSATGGQRELAGKIRRYLGIIRTVSEGDRSRIDAGAPGGNPKGRKKILLVSHGFPTLWHAGVELYTRNIARALRARGHDVAVLFPQEDAESRSPRVREGDHEGIRLYKILCRKGASRKFQLRNRNVENVFRNILDEERFEIVHFHHTYRFPFSLVNIAAARGVPVCLTLHDFWFLCPCIHLYVKGIHEVCEGPTRIGKCVECLLREHAGRQRKRWVLERFLTLRQQYVRRLLERTDILAAPSSFVAKKFESFGFGAGRIVVAPLGLELSGAVRIANPSGPPVNFAYIGTIHEVKNVVLLAAAFKSVRGSARLTIWGDGPSDEIARLEEEIAADPRIEYRGKYRPEMLGEMLGCVDMVVIPSLMESFSFAVREALMAGVPVIASNVGGIPEVVFHMQNGILFDPSDREELARRLQEVVDSPGIVDRLRDGITPVKSISEDADDWDQRYRELAERKGNTTGHRKSILDILTRDRRLAAIWKAIRGY